MFLISFAAAFISEDEGELIGVYFIHTKRACKQLGF